MRRCLTLFLAGTMVATLVACSAGANDPYVIAARAFSTGWDPVQINVGLKVEGGDSSLTIGEDAMQIVLDASHRKALVDISIPTAGLGADRRTLRLLGITGDSIDFDAVYDGEAIYAKGLLLEAALRSLLATSPDLPSGRLDGWLRLATRSELELYLADAAPMATPGVMVNTPEPDAAELRNGLAQVGMALSYVGTESWDGATAHHLHWTMDMAKLLDSSAADSLTSLQRDQMRMFEDRMSMSMDVRVDSTTDRLRHVDLNLSLSDLFSMTFGVSLGDPDPGTTIQAPTGAVPIPLRAIVDAFVRLSNAMVPSA